MGSLELIRAADPLDAYIKDSFCDSFTIKDPIIKRKAYRKVFSHLGGQNNPPDIMILGGEAIEVKKVEGFSSPAIALNSSYPKQKLYSKDPMISKLCRSSEDWKEKDMVYCVGNVINNKVKVIVFVYGDCYAASRNHYQKVKEFMIDGIKKLDLQLAKTRELGRLNGIDPLKITDMRIRGMFQIVPPLKLFSNIIKLDQAKSLSVFFLMRRERFVGLPASEQKILSENFVINDVKIKDPDEPMKELNAKLISFSF